MRVVFEFFEKLIETGLISEYVLGGATALLYYSSPTFTEDVDVFIQVKTEGPLINLQPIYDFAREQGIATEGEYLLVGGFPVQILTTYDALSREAFLNAIEVDILDVSVKIFGLEYLMAIMIQLGKQKYRERLRLLIVEKVFDTVLLEGILQRHELDDKWKQLKISL